MATGIDSVLAVLETAGFERLSSPLVVAGSTFDFDAAARGTVYSHESCRRRSNFELASRLVRLLSGLSLMLDQVASRRPITLVLLGEPLDRVERLPSWSDKPESSQSAASSRRRRRFAK